MGLALVNSGSQAAELEISNFEDYPQSLTPHLLSNTPDLSEACLFNF